MHLNRFPAALAVATVLSLVLAPTVMATQPVYKTGTGVIQQTCGADLDHGVFDCNGGSTDSNKDVYFIAHTSTNRVITYNNHIFNKIVKVASKPSYATCKSSALGFSEYNAKQNVGHWFCVLTSEGRYARLIINKVVAGGPMTITFKTWCKLGDAC